MQRANLKQKGAALAAPVRVKSRGRGRPRHTMLGPLVPARQILFLLRRQAVDLDAHGFEFQFCDALVEVDGHGETRFSSDAWFFTMYSQQSAWSAKLMSITDAG